MTSQRIYNFVRTKSIPADFSSAESLQFQWKPLQRTYVQTCDA